MQYTLTLLPMSYVVYFDGKAIFPAHAIRLSRIGNMRKAILWRKTTCKITMWSLVRNVCALEEDDDTHFVDVLTLKIVNDIISFNFCSFNSSAAYTRNFTRRRMMKKNQ